MGGVYEGEVVHKNGAFRSCEKETVTLKLELRKSRSKPNGVNVKSLEVHVMATKKRLEDTVQMNRPRKNI